MAARAGPDFRAGLFQLLCYRKFTSKLLLLKILQNAKILPIMNIRIQLERFAGYSAIEKRLRDINMSRQ